LDCRGGRGRGLFLRRLGRGEGGEVEELVGVWGLGARGEGRGGVPGSDRGALGG
jgi:hypothetical protein